MNFKKLSLTILLSVYCVLSVGALMLWNAKGINLITGDEPHYLVMANGIGKHLALEQTVPYAEEFKSREIFQLDSALKDEKPTPDNTHAYMGPNGLFNFHGLGLPIILAIPFVMGGALGAKLFLVIVGGLVVIVAWKFSAQFGASESCRFWTVIASTISIPLIPASNQIYPDLLAGLLSVIGLYWLFTANNTRSVGREILMAFGVAFLPWLQIKFIATCLVLITSISLKIYLGRRDLKRVALILFVAFASCALLATYNNYAFGKASGPYGSGALEMSSAALMVFVGLLIDQNQGIFMQNPIAVLGVFGIGRLYKSDRFFGLVWALVFLSLIVPNAMHPNWYGGGSFSGRFQWAAAIVFVVPTIYALSILSKNYITIFRAAIVLGTCLQLFFYYKYAIEPISMYNRPAGTWFGHYSIYYQFVDKWLPMLYDVRWAFGYLPNYIWANFLLSIFVLGFFRGRKGQYYIVLVVLFSFLALAFFDYKLPRDEVVFAAETLSSNTGKMNGVSRVAQKGVDSRGFLIYGPDYSLTSGRYKATLSYKSKYCSSENLGEFDAFNSTTLRILSAIPIYGTCGMKNEISFDFKSDHQGYNNFQFRLFWEGLSDLEAEFVKLEKYN